MWAGGGKKPVEDTVCGRRKRPWLARLHKLINEEQLRVESRIDCTPQVHSSVQNISHADAQEDQSAPSWSGWQLGLQCRQTGGGLNLHLPTHARTHARTHTRTHALEGWCELPRCVDLYQSPAIKLNWQTGTCTSPALQPVLLCSLNTCIRAHTAVLLKAKRKGSRLKWKWSNFLSCFAFQPRSL